MANVMAIMGESGSGKTTAMRNLDPETTFYIDCDGKGLNWKGWKKQYVPKKNYFKSDIPIQVIDVLYWLNGQRQTADQKGRLVVIPAEDKRGLEFKTVVVDTLNSIMVGEEMRNIKVNGYGKWTDLAQYVYNIIDMTLRFRDDLTVIFVCHSETVTDENTGERTIRIRTNGRKLEKIVLESKLTTVLYCKGHTLYSTFPGSTAKAPMGALPDEMENDIVPVIEALEEY